ncbi:nuclear transport factor 2 family protein [Hymenobacter cavernae]|uniref:SnoaL-like domain-containing protein n=1 Tax=Hymenobacter cavernae TaxID=2044852 RepID=A0ABQ1TV10_9BACT|nr:nuclear transport factor 2 family protein [Hymenobacter cavernae]GGF01788.1 hypothetical protein GCM10011383_10850 [Hymenobacter cavernae]
MNAHLDVIATYLDLVQSLNTDPAAYAAVLHPEVEQTEFPNFLNKTIQRRSFDEILRNLRAGRELLRDPDFDVQHIHCAPSGTVIVEGLWQATAINDMLPIIRGHRITAQLSLIFEFRDDKIYRQRRYPCFNLF